MKSFILITAVLSVMLIPGCNEEELASDANSNSMKLVDNPITHVNHQNVIILVDVNVSPNGKVIESILSKSQKYTSFNQLALTKAKAKVYPIKKGIKDNASYWLRDVPMTFSVSSMGSHNTPIELPDELKNKN
jgi:hypothetical protein